MEIRELTSRTIDVLRFPMAVMVVAIHSYFNESLNLRGTEIPFTGEWAHQIIYLFSIVLTDAAVPAFFVMSGFLYFFKVAPDSKLPHWGGYLQKTKRKVASLLIPYIMWNLLAIAIEPDNWHKSINVLLMGMWGIDGQGPWNSPLWFLRDLFVMMLLAPVFEIIVKKTKLLLPVLCLILMGGSFAGDKIVRGLSYVGICYFSLGAYVGIFHKEILSMLRKNNMVILTFYFLLMIVRFSSIHFSGLSEGMNTLISKLVIYLYILFSIPAWAIIASYIAERTKNIYTWKWLASSSFIVYVMHRLFNSKVSAFGLLIINKPVINGTEAVILYLLTICITVFVCIGFYWLLKKNFITNALFLGARKR